MYLGILFGIVLFGVFFVIMLIALLLGWSDCDKGDGWPFLVITFLFGLGLWFFWDARAKVLNRAPVVSRCIRLSDGRFELIDSSLLCECGVESRYTVIKGVPNMVPDERTPCENCGATMIFHCDSSCIKTEAQIEGELSINFINAP